MKQFILKIILVNMQLLGNNFKTTTMGLDYYIYPNKQTNCKDDFSSGLSFFFEQVGGYEEKAEVAQIEKILNIDLSVFQDVGYDPNDAVQIETHWKNIDSFTSLVDTFIAKIKAHPYYYKQVKHNPNRQNQLTEYSRIQQIQDTAEANRLYNKLEKEPFYFYPPDYGYLVKGQLLKDLQALKETLECYKKNGVTKIRLEYF